MTGRPFDAVLVVAFGGPEGMGDVRPFLEIMADEVVKTWDRYRTGRPLVLSAVNVAPTAQGTAR